MNTTTLQQQFNQIVSCTESQVDNLVKQATQLSELKQIQNTLAAEYFFDLVKADLTYQLLNGKFNIFITNEVLQDFYLNCKTEEDFENVTRELMATASGTKFQQWLSSNGLMALLEGLSNKFPDGTIDKKIKVLKIVENF